jgi:hypothetical protein
MLSDLGPSTLKGHVRMMFRQKRSRMSSDARNAFRQTFCVQQDEAATIAHRDTFLSHCKYKLLREDNTYGPGYIVRVDMDHELEEHGNDWTNTEPYLQYVTACHALFAKLSGCPHLHHGTPLC